MCRQRKWSSGWDFPKVMTVRESDRDACVPSGLQLQLTFPQLILLTSSASLQFPGDCSTTFPWAFTLHPLRWLFYNNSLFPPTITSPASLFPLFLFLEKWRELPHVPTTISTNKRSFASIMFCFPYYERDWLEAHSFFLSFLKHKKTTFFNLPCHWGRVWIVAKGMCVKVMQATSMPGP